MRLQTEEFNLPVTSRLDALDAAKMYCVQWKTPACAKDDRIVQFSKILHITIVTARYGLRLGSTKRVSIELARGIYEDNCKTTSYGDAVLKLTLEIFHW